jgi:hypothetical protein
MNGPGSRAGTKGPIVWLDMDHQAALNDAYDQLVYAPNRGATQLTRVCPLWAKADIPASAIG